MKREEHWMKSLRIIFPYGLKERARENNDNSSVGSLFPSIPRTASRQPRDRNNRNEHCNNDSLDNVFDTFHRILLTNRKNALYTPRVILNKSKKKTLKQIAGEILYNNNKFDFDYKNEQYYLYILDIIDTKIFKPKTHPKKLQLNTYAYSLFHPSANNIYIYIVKYSK